MKNLSLFFFCPVLTPTKRTKRSSSSSTWRTTTARRWPTRWRRPASSWRRTRGSSSNCSSHSLSALTGQCSVIGSRYNCSIQKLRNGEALVVLVLGFTFPWVEKFVRFEPALRGNRGRNDFAKLLLLLNLIIIEQVSFILAIDLIVF